MSSSTEWPSIEEARLTMEAYGIKSYADMQAYALKILPTWEYPETTRYEKRLTVLVCTESMLKYRNQISYRDLGLVESLGDKLIRAKYPDEKYLEQWKEAHNDLYPDMSLYTNKTN